MIKYDDLIQGTSMLSPSVLHKHNIGNATHIPLRDLLDRELLKSDNGYDVGTASYLVGSSYFFIKAKAIQRERFTPCLDGEGAISINPKSFVNYFLKSGDLLVSKDSNVGECVLLDEDLPSYMPCGAIYRLPISTNKLYIFAYMKSQYFMNQLDSLVPKGATIRHAGNKFLNCLVPFPSREKESKIALVENVVEMIIRKERLIRNRHDKIHKIIESELENNNIHFDDVEYKTTKYQEITLSKRIDATYYSQKAKYQKAVIQNYRYGYKTLKDLGYRMKRGQNLQVTNIGKSVYSDTYKPNFYTVIKPTNFTDYGTVGAYEFLGNKNTLQILTNGDIVFSAEGTVGKCVLFVNTGEKWITNIHGIVLSPNHHNEDTSSYVSCILRFYRNWGYYDHFTVGGQGGSLGKNYWKDIIIPNFPKDISSEIALLYHSSTSVPFSEGNITDADNHWNSGSGIIEIENSIQFLRKLLNEIIGHISNDDDFSVNDYKSKIVHYYSIQQ